MLLAADHVRHLHERVIHWAGELIGRIGVRLDDDEVADQIAVEMHLATHHVAELDVTAWDFEAYGEESATLGWAVQAPSRVFVGTLFELRLLALRLQFLRRAVAAIRPALFDQPRRFLAVRVEPLRLAVRLRRCAFVTTPLPNECQPTQAFIYKLLALAAVAFPIRVVAAPGGGAA